MNAREIVAAAIKRHGSLYKVAKILGVDYSTAHDWKTGKAEPRTKNLLRLIALAGKKIHVIALGVVTLLALQLSPQIAKANPFEINTVTSHTSYTLCEFI